MPVSIARLRELIDLAAAEGVAELDIVENGVHIRIGRSAEAPARKPAGFAAAPAHEPAPAAAADPQLFKSPMFGVFHLTPAPGAAPYVAVGDSIERGRQLCLIEAMKMFSAVHSDRDGRIAAILAASGEEVASGQPLFRIAQD